MGGADIPLQGRATELIYLFQWEACNVAGSDDSCNSSKGVVVNCWVLGVGKQGMQSLHTEMAMLAIRFFDAFNTGVFSTTTIRHLKDSKLVLLDDNWRRLCNHSNTEGCILPDN